MSQDSLKRIPFVITALTGKELTAVNRDVSRVYNLLIDPKIGMCQSDGFKPLYECKSPAEFLQNFQSVLSQYKNEAQLIFYFSGHGDNRNGLYCLKMGVNDSDWFPFDNLINYLKINNVNRAILILDACHSGMAIDGIKNSNRVPDINIKENDIPKGFALIASCRESQVSQELIDGSSGVFTHIFCQAIETNLDGKGTNDGYIYTGDIVDYINHKLETEEAYRHYTQRATFCIHKAERNVWIAKTKKIQDNNRSEPTVSDIEEQKMLYERTPLMQRPCADTNSNDLDRELLEDFLQRNIDLLDLAILERYQTNDNKINVDSYINDNLEEILSRLGLYSSIQVKGKNYLKKVAVLCFCKRPDKFYPQARAVFTAGDIGIKNNQGNKGKGFVRETITGPLSYQIEKLVEKVEKHSHTLSDIGQDGLRRDIQTIDMTVARELISNAIAHRDYESESGVKVAITKKALEVYSPGKFSSDLSWDKLIDHPHSYPVCAEITSYLAILRTSEKSGRGFTVFKNYIEENGRDSIICQELPGPTICISLLHRGGFEFVPATKDAHTQPINGGWQGVGT